MSITARAFARAGLVGNPSDGYFGKTISFTIRDFAATVTLTEADHFDISPTPTPHPAPGDGGRYDSVDAFLHDTRLMGYYGATRLIKAAIKRFHDFATARGEDLSGRPSFAVALETTIPRLVGLSGSSAIVIATLRALETFYAFDVPRAELPTLALEVETKELNIAAGLQDRVVQTYENLVYMDFDRAHVERTGGGRYENITPNTPTADLPVYVAFDAERAEVSDVAHRNLRAAWESGERDVVGAMQELAALTDRGRSAIENGDWRALHEVTNANFDVRKRIMPIARENQRMIDVARETGASAKFAGSGGAITGVYLGDEQFDNLRTALGQIGCTTFKPRIFA